MEKVATGFNVSNNVLHEIAQKSYHSQQGLTLSTAHLHRQMKHLY